MSSWIPQAVFEGFNNLAKERAATGEQLPMTAAVQKFPHIRGLVPALLDRGDPQGRDFAFGLTAVVKSPEFLDALQDFASGKRGPDALRNEALTVLRQEGRIGIGPHRLFLNGEWTEIEIFSPTITDEPLPVTTPGLQELLNEGYFAMDSGDHVKAEQIFRRCVELDPDSESSAHNLAGALMMYDDAARTKEARTLLEGLRERFPDYLFASTSLAQLAIKDGDLQTARDLVAPLRRREELHRSEMMAVLSVSASLAFADDNLDSARATVSMMEQLDPGHLNSTTFRRRLDFATSRKELLSGTKGLQTLKNLASQIGRLS
jgi:tetratricopeptide (TPR) repeat protein